MNYLISFKKEGSPFYAVKTKVTLTDKGIILPEEKPLSWAR